ncbi:MAG: sigma-70 family RNA polymerase sigma factor [Bacteroidia bacterium]
MILSVIIRFLDKRRTADIRHLTALDDARLVIHYCETRDGRAVSVLLDRYADLIVGKSVRYLQDAADVEDFANDLFVRLTEKLPTSDIRSFKPWLMTLVTNMLHDIGRGRGTRDKHFKIIGERMMRDGRSDSMDADLDMDRDLLYEALDTLNDLEQRCLRKLYFLDMSYQEIMEEEDLTFNQLRGMRDRCIKKLREKLGTDFVAYFKDRII